MKARSFPLRAAIGWYLSLKTYSLYGSQSMRILWLPPFPVYFHEWFGHFFCPHFLVTRRKTGPGRKMLFWRKWDMSRQISETISSTTLVLNPGALKNSRAFLYFSNNLFMRSKKSSTRTWIRSISFWIIWRRWMWCSSTKPVSPQQFYWTGWQFTVVNWLYIIKSKDFTFTKHINKRSSCRTVCITYHTLKVYCCKLQEYT